MKMIKKLLSRFRKKNPQSQPKLKIESVARGLVADVSAVPGLNASNLPPATAFDNDKDFDITYQGHTIKASQAPRSLIEEMAKAQQKQDLVRFNLQVERDRAKLQKQVEEAEKQIMALEKRQTQAYTNLMGYPGPGTTLYDRYENLYRVDSCAESLKHNKFPDVVLKIVSKFTEEESNALDIIWVPTKRDMALLFNSFINWPIPTPPAVFCFTGEDDQVWFAQHQPLDGSALFKKITDWNELVVDGIINRMVNYKAVHSTDYTIPKTLEPDQQDKFDVFLDTLKLRAEIIEEVKQVKN